MILMSCKLQRPIKHLANNANECIMITWKSRNNSLNIHKDNIILAFDHLTIWII